MAVLHSYIRFSTMSQADGHSLARQTDEAERVAERLSIPISTEKFIDKGRSAHKGQKQARLTAFLEAINDGRVRPGDFLLVEAIDRLSRRGIRETQTLINTILDAGVHIIITTPHEKTYRADDRNNIGDAIELAAFAYQAYVYSKNLSERICKETAAQRKTLAETGKQMRQRKPGWINPDNTLNDEAAAAIRFIFDRVIEGFGATVIAKELNQKFRPLGYGKHRMWNQTYIRNVLAGRQVLGEFTPHALDENGKRIPAGPTVIGYYPAVVDEKTWDAAQAAIANRSIERGPSGKFVNLFTGLLWHLPDKCTAQVQTFRAKAKRTEGYYLYRRIMSYRCRENAKGASRPTVDLQRFENAVLTYLHELETEDVLIAPTNEHTRALQAVRGKLVGRRKRLKELKDALTGEDDVLELKSAIKEVNGEIQTLTAQEREISAKAFYDPAEALVACQRAIPLATTNEGRQRLREALKRLVSQINIAPHKLGTAKNAPVACTIELCFRDGLRRLLAFCSTSGVAVMSADDYTQFPQALHDREDLSDWLRSNAENLSTIFVDTPRRKDLICVETFQFESGIRT